MRPRPAFTPHELAGVFVARWQSAEFVSPFIRHMHLIDQSILREFWKPLDVPDGEAVRIRPPRFEWRDA